MERPVPSERSRLKLYARGRLKGIPKAAVFASSLLGVTLVTQRLKV